MLQLVQLSPPSSIPLHSLFPTQFILSCMLTIFNLFWSCHCRRKGDWGRSSSRNSRRTRRRQVMETLLLLPPLATVLHREFGARHCIFTFPKIFPTALLLCVCFLCVWNSPKCRMQHGGGLANSKLVSMISTWEKAQTKRTTTTTATAMAMATAMIATTTTVTATSTTTWNKQVAGKQANKQHFSCLAQKMAFLIAHYARLSSARIAAKLHCKVDKGKGREKEELPESVDITFGGNYLRLKGKFFIHVRHFLLEMNFARASRNSTKRRFNK